MVRILFSLTRWVSTSNSSIVISPSGCDKVGRSFTSSTRQSGLRLRHDTMALNPGRPLVFAVLASRNSWAKTNLDCAAVRFVSWIVSRARAACRRPTRSRFTPATPCGRRAEILPTELSLDPIVYRRRTIGSFPEPIQMGPAAAGAFAFQPESRCSMVGENKGQSECPYATLRYSVALTHRTTIPKRIEPFKESHSS